MTPACLRRAAEYSPALQTSSDASSLELRYLVAMITVLIFFGLVELEMRRGAQWPILAYVAIGALGGQDALAMYSAGLIAVGLAEIGLRILKIYRGHLRVRPGSQQLRLRRTAAPSAATA